MEHETRSDTPAEEPTSKTSFLIEDILYRGQSKFKSPTPVDSIRRAFDYDRVDPKPFYSVPADIRQLAPRRDGSYLQVAMGALGAYLHTPNTYKTVDAPYFLSQGLCTAHFKTEIRKFRLSSTV